MGDIAACGTRLVGTCFGLGELLLPDHTFFWWAVRSPRNHLPTVYVEHIHLKHILGANENQKTSFVFQPLPHWSRFSSEPWDPPSGDGLQFPLCSPRRKRKALNADGQVPRPQCSREYQVPVSGLSRVMGENHMVSCMTAYAVSCLGPVSCLYRSWPSLLKRGQKGILR